MKLCNIKVFFKDCSVLRVDNARDICGSHCSRQEFLYRVSISRWTSCSWQHHEVAWLMQFSLIPNRVQKAVRVLLVAHVEKTRQETARITKDSTDWVPLKKQKPPRRRQNKREIYQGLNQDHWMPYKMSLRIEWSNAKKIPEQIQFFMPHNKIYGAMKPNQCYVKNHLVVSVSWWYFWKIYEV